MELKINIPQQSIEKWKKSLDNKLQIAAVRGWETAVELTPAAAESKYSTGFLRQSLRFHKTGEMSYTIISPASHSAFVEFGTGPKGAATGAMPEFPNDPNIAYHDGEVIVTRHRGQLLTIPYIRHTQGMKAQPFLRPALLRAIEEFKKLLKTP